MKKKLLVLLLILSMAVTLMTGCSSSESAESNANQNGDTTVGEETSDKITLQMVNCAFGIQFCEVEREGAEAAAAELGNVEIVYNAPQQASDIQGQIDMFNSAISQQPDALLIAALDPGSVTQSLLIAQEKGIPVIAFDTSLPDAPEGSVAATVHTNNVIAAELAAENMWKSEQFQSNLANASVDTPVVVSIISPDATTNTHADRIQGFTQKIVELAEEKFHGAISVEGSSNFEDINVDNPTFIINIGISSTSSDEDVRRCAQSILSTDNQAGIFCVNEASVTALLSASTDGTDLDPETGKYKDIVVVGFDAGSTLKNAVKNEWFYGAVAQNPYDIGYQAVMTAVSMIQNGSAEDVDAEAKWYDVTNMEDEDIAKILYD